MDFHSDDHQIENVAQSLRVEIRCADVVYVFPKPRSGPTVHDLTQDQSVRKKTLPQ